MPTKKIFSFALYALLFINIFLLSTILSFQITLQGEMVSLPDLVGKSVDEAKLLLEQKKLQLINSGVQLHERLEKGKIVSQDPAADSKVKLYSDVRVILSAGKEKVVVPDLVGKNLQNINPILNESGLRKGKISHVHTPKYAAGKIIAQSPTPSEEVGRDTQISFLVSQGEHEIRYLMPDLIGKKAALIIAQLKSMDFNVGNIRYRFYRGLDSGIIINQSPAPGSKIQKRNRITFEVSK